MTQYDPKIILKFADALYAQANSAVALGVLGGLVSGGAAGLVSGALFSIFSSDSKMMGLLAGAVVGGLIGGVIGERRALALRMQAQTALCQMKIEENTRYLVQLSLGVQQSPQS